MRVAINGFGRIGRSFLRASLRRDAPFEVVAVNDLAPPATLAHLLTYDTAAGVLDVPVAVADGALAVGGRELRVLSTRDPGALPWRELAVDVVVESTGAFTDASRARAHLDAGARKVLVSAPARGEDLTVAYGINSAQYDPARHHVVSAASCTTGSLAPLAKVLHDLAGIDSGLMTTVHAYTQDQNLQDGPHGDLRRARAAAHNIVPTTSGAATAIGRVLPALDGRLSGFALRVPVLVGSITDLTVTTSRQTTAEEVTAAFRTASEGELRGVLAYSEAPIVSSDIVGSPASAVFDAPLTAVSGRTVKVLGWYDNEWGFSNRLVDVVELMGQHL
ncbi:type I glyceraldehyde-3-phosphate dehydrogenase [Vallicoccus soli]|uniref:Glyceraldehyde-3-phosphate dehydrogenase n=1 Tax=Vallicoccus soli TaxID=2339232 RepID=A0A3A3YTP2_9ACTN|nr:type I glyceraldehyde-3-phosphate dehydrogenase [Vallicoccus soli]RJK94854.1 type I glyceraldehyde-3-phosphate dehydrogenase [Vallicoccus soli]